MSYKLWKTVQFWPPCTNWGICQEHAG